MLTGFEHKGNRPAWAVYLAILGLLTLLIPLTGCGGGGGGGGATATIKGRVLRVETNAAPSPVGAITVNGASTQTSATDGTFTLTVSAAATSAAIVVPQAQTRTVTFQLTAGQTTDLGDIFVTDSATGYTATVTGRIVTPVNSTQQPVTNATVILGGTQTKTDVNGKFTLTGLPVGLGSAAGTIGKVTAAGFDDKPITSDVLGPPLVTGANAIGDIPIAAKVSVTPPTTPYTIKGVVTLNGVATANVLVSLAVGQNSLGSTRTDANGAYFFWVTPDTYIITASQTGFTSKQVNVTLNRLDTPVTAPAINLTP
jgi:hypothetical protein